MSSVSSTSTVPVGEISQGGVRLNVESVTQARELRGQLIAGVDVTTACEYFNDGDTFGAIGVYLCISFRSPQFPYSR